PHPRDTGWPTSSARCPTACSGVGFGVAAPAGFALATLLDGGAFALCRAVAPSLGRAPLAPWPVSAPAALEGALATDSLFGLPGSGAGRAGRGSTITGSSVTAALRAGGELSLVWPGVRSDPPERGLVKI